jgi:hypothetical protein
MEGNSQEENNSRTPAAISPRRANRASYPYAPPKSTTATTESYQSHPPCLATLLYLLFNAKVFPDHCYHQGSKIGTDMALN